MATQARHVAELQRPLPAIRLKVKVDAVIATEHSPTYRSTQVVLVPVFDDHVTSGAATISTNTPTGRIELLVENLDAISRLTIGRQFFVELVPAD